MGAVQDREKAFQDQFNALLGSKIGRPLKPYKNYQPSEQVRSQLNKILIEGAKAQKEILAGPKRRTGSSSTKRGSLLTDAQKSAREKQFLKESKVTKEGNRSFFDKFKDVASRGLDLISRPGYAVTGALYEQAKAMAEGEPFWSTVDELGYGAWRGASGQAQEGGGDVLREYKKGQHYKGGGLAGFLNTAYNFHAKTNPLFPTFLPQAAAEVSKKLPPTAEKWFDRVAGGGFDIGFDPLTYIGVGTIAKARNVERGLEGVDLVREGAKRTAAKASAPHVGLKGADEVGEAVSSKVDDLAFDVTKGAQRGKTVGGGREMHDTVANYAGDTARTKLIEDIRPMAEQVLTQAKTGNPVNIRRINGWKQAHPNFKVWYDEFEQTTRQMTVNGPVSNTLLDDASRVAFEHLGVHLAPVADDVAKAVKAGLRKNIIKAPAIKVLGHTVGSSDRAGILLNKIAEKISRSKLDDISKSLSYGRGNPGAAIAIGRKTRSELTHLYKTLILEVKDRAKLVNDVDARTLSEALQDGVQLADPVLEAHRTWLRNKYDEIFQLEEAYGLRNSIDPLAEKGRMNDYVYTTFKKNSKDAKAIQDKMRLHVKKNRNYDGYKISDLELMGVKPETNAFQNVINRQLKANKDIAPIHYIRSLLSTRVVKGTISAKEMAERDLIEVTKGSRELPQSLAASLKPGERLYITKDTEEIMKRYRAFADVGSKEHAELLHTVDYVTSKFKRLSTLYYPSFHVRNFVGDMYMGAIDGVHIRDYNKIFNKWRQRASAKLTIGGSPFSFHELVEMYEKNLSSAGHFPSEIATANIPKRISGSIGDWAEKREDFGRFTHFTHALDEELTHQLKRYSDPNKAMEKALDAAAYRVDKYKFDYSGLTNFEQKYLKRVIPFYTYPRKAISTLAEATLISPRQLSNTAHLINNWQTYAEQGNDEFDWIGLPGWMRDSPVIPFTGGANPLGIDVGSMLPIGGATDWMQNPLSNVNPLIRSVPELTFARNAFTHEEVKNPLDVVMQNLRPLAEWKRATKGGTPVIVKLSNFIGVPVRKISQGQQDSQVESLKYKAKGQIHKMDDRAMEQGYHVVFSERKYDDKYGGVSVRIYNQENNSLIGEFNTIPEAEIYLNKLLAGNK